jgi:putative transposase
MANNPLYFKNKYRIPSARLLGWDYRTAAPYFVTICTKNRQPFFGSIQHGVMVLNPLGQFASQCIDDISDHSGCAIIANQIVMPNHVHAIIELNNPTMEYEPSHFGPLLKKSLSSVVNHYKGRVTKFAGQSGVAGWSWQPLYHDHIIRNNEEYQRVFNYITNNPKDWETDNFFRE